MNNRKLFTIFKLLERYTCFNIIKNIIKNAQFKKCDIFKVALSRG